MTKKYFIFKCGVCKKVFEVPYFEDPGQAPEEMLQVMEHEEAHTDDGNQPSWDCDTVEREEP